MRVMAWVALVLLLAGCATKSDTRSPSEEAIASTDGSVVDREIPAGVVVENVSMDPVSGTVSRDGEAHETCSSASITGGVSSGGADWTTKVGTNATRIHLSAEWAATNPTTETLYFDIVYKGEILTTVGGTSGLAVDVDASDISLDDRSVTIRIGSPRCGADPAAVTYYQGVSASVGLEFLA